MYIIYIYIKIYSLFIDIIYYSFIIINLEKYVLYIFNTTTIRFYIIIEGNKPKLYIKQGISIITAIMTGNNFVQQ